MLVGDPALRLVMVVLFVQLVFMSTTIPAEVFFVKDVLGAGDLGFGALYALWFAGMAVGALVLPRFLRSAHLVPVVLVAIVVQGLGAGSRSRIGLAALLYYRRVEVRAPEAPAPAGAAAQ